MTADLNYQEMVHAQAKQIGTLKIELTRANDGYTRLEARLQEANDLLNKFRSEFTHALGLFDKDKLKQETIRVRDLIVKRLNEKGVDLKEIEVEEPNE